jgi:Cdc6-like AAA superfamily ATPase
MIYCPNQKCHPQMTLEMCRARIERGEAGCRARNGKGYACPVADGIIKEKKEEEKKKKKHKEREVDVMTSKVTRQVAEVVDHCGGDERCAVAYLLGQVEYTEKQREQDIKRLEAENERLREVLRETKKSWV